MRGKVSKVRLDLKLVQVEWEPDSSEAAVLRKFVNEIRTRRAFEPNRGMALEEPVRFLASVTEFRGRLRDLVNALPPRADQSRLALLTAMDWAGELLDAWHLALRDIAPNTWEFSRLDLRQMMDVMETVWPMVETVRKMLDGLVDHVEQQLAK
jgi:hypothetical protein